MSDVDAQYLTYIGLMFVILFFGAACGFVGVRLLEWLGRKP